MTAPAIGGADSDIVVTETTKNQGTGASLPSKTGFYLSANTTLDAADPWIGDRTVSSLGPGITAQASTTLHIPLSTATGLYRILAKADWDNTINESSETNNTRTIVIQIGPDLAVSALTASSTAAAGGAISVSDTTRTRVAEPPAHRRPASTGPRTCRSMRPTRSLAAERSGRSPAEHSPAPRQR